jgi:hypothetical protein
MAIYRSTDPTTWDDVDQVVIAEVSPPQSISGVATNIAILVGRFERGPANTLHEIGSTGELHELYGNSTFSGNQELKNKRFGRLKLIRVINFKAKYLGAYGDNIQVKIEDGSVSGKKYTVHDSSTIPSNIDEVYDNLAITDIDAATFAGSKMVDVTVLATTEEPTNIVYTNLTGGSDGTTADSDYETALIAAEQEQAGNMVWADKQSSTVKNALEQHVLNAPDKIAIIAPDDDTVDEAASITEVAGYRSDRIIYSYPYIKTQISGVDTLQSPCSWYASIMSQMAPHKDPASVEAVAYTAGILELNNVLSRADYINFKDAGISAFEFDPDYGFKVKTGCLTTLTAGLTQVLRRRMTDFLTNSIGRFLKGYQNKVNSKPNRDLAKAAILNFDKRLENEGILPNQNDVKSGLPVLVDTESLNTDDLVAQGYFKILYRRRIYSSMRYIVLLAEIGEGVLVKEA